MRVVRVRAVAEPTDQLAIGARPNLRVEGVRLRDVRRQRTPLGTLGVCAAHPRRQVATDNEALMTRLHHLTLELMVIEGLGPFFDHLSQALLSEFKADILNISLFDRDVETQAKTPVLNLRRDDPELKPFEETLDKGETICGRLNRNKLDFLFGNRAQWVQSTALVPLGKDGLLAIGSSDAAYFYPGMGTLFLDLLATVITRRLELAEPSKQRRSA